MYRVVEDFYGRSGMGAMPAGSGIWAQTSAERQHYEDLRKHLGKERVCFYYIVISVHS